MTFILTLLAIALTCAIVALVTWEVIHRRSPLVRRWNPSTFAGRVTGGLGMLEGGEISSRLRRNDPEVIVLLHGLDETADYFGDLYEGLAADHRLVMPDLLGFGRSLDEQRSDYSLEAHVDAVDGALESLGLGDARVMIAAHSMGAAVALAWAKRHPSRTTQVLLWGPPVYPSCEAARSIRDARGGMARLALADTDWSQKLGRLGCEHRHASGWVVAATTPSWPIDVSRRSSLHTWEAYQRTLTELVLDADWDELFDVDVPVTILLGETDRIGDRNHLARVARDATIVDVPGADHHVAITHPHLLYDVLDQAA